MNKFYLVKFLTNTQEQDGSSLAVYDSYEKAVVAYHQTLATYYNAQDVAHAVVEILDTYGRIVGNFHEEVNHYQPEPEPNEE